MPAVRHLFVTQDYPPDLGGIARRHVELCRRFHPEPVIVSTVAAPGADAFDAREPYEIRREPFPFAGAKLLQNQMRWAGSLSRAIRGGIDLIHCGNIRPAGYPVWWARRRHGTPYLLYVNGMDLMRERRKARLMLKRWTGRAIFAGADGIVANSTWTAELARIIMREFGIRRPPPVRPIDLGTDPEQFHPRNDTGVLRRRLGLGDAPLMVTVARLMPHKGQDVALGALAELRGEFPELRYLIVGEGPDEARLRRLARELGVEDRVTFAGALADAEVAEAYATASVYVGLSRIEDDLEVEGFGIAFVEAGASGVPVVAGDSGGVRSAVRDEETGYLVPPRHAGRAAVAVARLLREPERRKAMGAAGREAVERYYNWNRVAEDTREFAREVTARARL